MDEPKKIKVGDTVELPTTLCPLCDEPVANGQLLLVKCPVHSHTQSFIVCGKHLPPDLLIQLDDRLRALAAHEIVRRVTERGAYLRAENLPSLRRPPVKRPLEPARLAWLANYCRRVIRHARRLLGELSSSQQKGAANEIDPRRQSY